MTLDLRSSSPLTQSELGTVSIAILSISALFVLICITALIFNEPQCDGARERAVKVYFASSSAKFTFFEVTGEAYPALCIVSLRLFCLS